MRLIELDDESGFRLVQFVGKKIPPYAILSHTWGPANEEVSYADFVADLHKEKDKEGWSKIFKCARQARTDGLRHIWIDTCCINKESSAELSEAINSMFAWYRQAELCYAYLGDITDGDLFCTSRWFTRGWTLQELLAPADVLFFDANWYMIGFKTSLTTTISERTGINSRALHDGTSLDTYSIAERMSWAAGRQTERVEDEAYSLMGIFDVNMPLIYGEGRKAFVRLQEELLKRTDDASIFAYVSLKPSKSPGPTTLKLIESDNGKMKVLENFHTNTDVQTDEEQYVGTVGLYSLSPEYFREAAKYVPYPTLDNIRKHRDSDAQSSLRVRRSGHLVKFQTALWKVPVRELVHDTLAHDSAVQTAVLRAHGVKLTMLSIQKLRKCAQAVPMDAWKVAFLDCRRRNGGIVGIVLRENVKKGLYTRQHFPSLVETEHVTSFYSEMAVHTVYIEAGSLRTDPANDTSPAHLSPKIMGASHNETVLRATNLHEYGLSQEFEGADRILHRTVYWHSTDSRIPLIALAAQMGHHKTSDVFQHGDEQGVTCRLYPNVHKRYISNIELSKQEPEAFKFIPTYRGLTTYMPLTTHLKLVFRGQMQWKRENLLHHVDHFAKYCLLSVLIVEADLWPYKSLLEDPASKRAPLSAINHHLTIPATKLL